MSRKSFFESERISVVGRWIGVVLFLGFSFFYAAAGLVAPLWGIGVLWAFWLVMVVSVVRRWRAEPWFPLTAAVILVLFWVALLLMGEFFLGWSA